MALVVFAGCASGTSSNAPIDSNNGQVDSPPQNDAAPMVDAAPMIDAAPNIDAPPVDAMIDAPPLPPDACVPMVTELLVNGGMDNAAITPWTEVRYFATDALIVDQSVLGFNADTPTKYAWIGGYEAPFGSTATDGIYQIVNVPAMTSNITITGYVAVASEDSTLLAFDNAAFVIFMNNSPTGTTVLAVDNTDDIPMWQAFSFNVPSPQTWSGQTMQVQMASSSDDIFPTYFLFDSISVRATHGCP